MNKIIKYKNIYWIYTSIYIFIIDLIIKNLFIIKLCIGCKFYFCFFINITHIHNLGTIFNFLSNGYIWQTCILNVNSIFIIFLSLINIIIFNNNIIDNMSSSMILGGAMGNLFDRLNNKFIIDYIDFHIKNFHFPIFNISDISITIGLFLIIFKKVMI
ncbi:MAG: signal peptidase II [Candidatus Makana argininalis]